MQTVLASTEQAGEQKVHGPASAQQFSANWFAAYTSSHHEKRVASYLAERRIKSFLPLYAIARRWNNRCEMHLDLPLFRNYVFVHIDPRKRVRVLEVPGVLSLVGFGRILASLPDREIEAIRAGIGQWKIEPHPYLVAGEPVRIKAGPMAGMGGVLVRMKNNFQVVIARRPSPGSRHYRMGTSQWPRRVGNSHQGPLRRRIHGCAVAFPGFENPNAHPVESTEDGRCATLAAKSLHLGPPPKVRRSTRAVSLKQLPPNVDQPNIPSHQGSVVVLL